MRTADATGRRKFAGVLRGAEAGRVEIELEGRVVGLALEDLDKAKLIPEL
jgi:ribosome maturation factor RimP